jgi:hypothetical protein
MTASISHNGRLAAERKNCLSEKWLTGPEQLGVIGSELSRESELSRARRR